VTGVLVALLAVLWAAVLLPVLLSAKQNTSITGSVGTFSRSMRALSSNHIQPAMGGRWVLTPRRPNDQEERKTRILKRRRIFVSLLGALGFNLFLGILPGFHSMLWVSLILAVTLGGYVAFLLQEKNREPAHRRLAPPIPGNQRPVEDVPTALRLAYTPPTPITRNGVRPVHRIVDASLEEDDGLSELAWARAARN
jgi:hypothetical protein